MPTSAELNVAVIGLGYIGLPTAALIARSGAKVLGIDVSAHVVDTVNSGRVHIEEVDLDGLVQGLTDGQTYTCTVAATNATGTGPASAASNSVVPGTTPAAPTLVGVVSRKNHAAAGDQRSSPDPSYTIGVSLAEFLRLRAVALACRMLAGLDERKLREAAKRLAAGLQAARKR